MNLKVRYENTFQTVILSDEDTKQLCVTLSIEEENPSEEQIQKEFDIQFNRPDYNCWHKFNRHITPAPKIKLLNGKGGKAVNHADAEGGDFFELLVDEDSVMPDFEYEDICALINSVLKPNQADIIIAVVLNNQPLKDYASQHGWSVSDASHRLSRAKNNLKKILENRQL